MPSKLLIWCHLYRCDLANRGHAVRSALHQPWPALDNGNHIAALNAITRVVHCRARRVQWIHLHNNMDCSVPQHQHAGPQVQERLTHIVTLHSIVPNLSTHLVPHVLWSLQTAEAGGMKLCVLCVMWCLINNCSNFQCIEGHCVMWGS